jgi:hypothetical protein
VTQDEEQKFHRRVVVRGMAARFRSVAKLQAPAPKATQTSQAAPVNSDAMKVR